MYRIEEPWTKEKLEQWTKDRRAGIQYSTPYGDCVIPKRWWESKDVKEQRDRGN